MPTWDPTQYLTFAQERTQPAIDLVARIPLSGPARIIDIGCGPGNSTQVLVQRYPHATVIGLDSSAEMIARAKADFPTMEWRHEDAATFSETDAYDLVFSNAVFQWIPNHEDLVPRLMRAVRPGGVLAFQIPGNHDSPLHQSLLRMARQSPWDEYLGNSPLRLVYGDLPFYYDLLAPLSAKVDLWETTYFHTLASHQALIEWYRGTGMRPFLEKLPNKAAQARFEQEVLQGCAADYPLQADGRLFFPFRRLFCVARKPA